MRNGLVSRAMARLTIHDQGLSGGVPLTLKPVPLSFRNPLLPLLTLVSGPPSRFGCGDPD